MSPNWAHNNTVSHHFPFVVGAWHLMRYYMTIFWDNFVMMFSEVNHFWVFLIVVVIQFQEHEQWLHGDIFVLWKAFHLVLRGGICLNFTVWRQFCTCPFSPIGLNFSTKAFSNEVLGLCLKGMSHSLNLVLHPCKQPLRSISWALLDKSSEAFCSVSCTKLMNCLSLWSCQVCQKVTKQYRGFWNPWWHFKLFLAWNFIMHVSMNVLTMFDPRMMLQFNGQMETWSYRHPAWVQPQQEGVVSLRPHIVSHGR